MGRAAGAVQVRRDRGRGGRCARRIRRRRRDRALCRSGRAHRPRPPDGGGWAIQYVKQWGRAGKQGVWTGEQSGEVVDKGFIEEP